ncbi:hypothetical protein [Algoriella sp.]|uniref:hypothetical protein n=1 Tax=Algoriella sp. TaxID=1872434 RepID=UPI002FCA18D9
MKKKDNISKHIFNELEQRELNPSHDAWDRIQARMDVAPIQQSQSNFKWWLSAAVIAIFTVSTSVYLYINQTEANVEVVHQPMQNTVDSSISNHDEIVDKHTDELANNEKNDSATKIEQVQPKTEKQVVQKGKVQIAVNKEMNQVELSIPKSISVTEKKEIIKENLVPKQSFVANNSLDSIKKLKKKKNFVDPNMLLYSIENKENLKESNQSRVVSIGFN